MQHAVATQRDRAQHVATRCNGLSMLCCRSSSLSARRGSSRSGSLCTRCTGSFARTLRSCAAPRRRWYGLLSPPATFAPRPGLPLPHLHRDWAHPAHICAGPRLWPATSAPGTWLTAATPETGPGSPQPHLRRDWAGPIHRAADRADRGVRRRRRRHVRAGAHMPFRHGAASAWCRFGMCPVARCMSHARCHVALYCNSWCGGWSLHAI